MKPYPAAPAFPVTVFLALENDPCLIICYLWTSFLFLFLSPNAIEINNFFIGQIRTLI